MKLNCDNMRNVLLALEEMLTVEQYGSNEFTTKIDSVDLRVLRKSEFLHEIPTEEITYILIKLKEADFITCTESIADGGVVLRMVIHSITYAGHQYLDSIRDDTIWKETMAKIAKFTSSATVQIIGQVASTIIAAKLNLLS